MPGPKRSGRERTDEWASIKQWPLNLSGAIFGGTTLAKIDLRTTKGLAEIEHRAPSHIELFTIQLPQNGSALHFLRGAGVPDEWIDDYRARMIHPIQYYSCFISSSSKDETLARRLHTWPEDGQHILALGLGGPLHLSGQAE